MERFTFGRNWSTFSQSLSLRDVNAAEESIRRLTAGRLSESGWLAVDLGCGSGLFSIALSRLGADRVVGLDLDPDCIRTSAANVGRFVPSDRRDSITFVRGSVLDERLMRTLPKADVVYAWGSLHHTGDMCRAFALAAERVRPGGLFVAAIYNRCSTSAAWHAIKRVYSRCPAAVQRLLATGLFGARAVVRAARGRHPFRERRGMSVYRDAFDWLGGYPYEYETVDGVVQMARQLELELVDVWPTRGSGCNEFLFSRPIATGQVQSGIEKDAVQSFSPLALPRARM